MLHLHFLIFFQVQSCLDRSMKYTGKGIARLDLPIFQNSGGRLIFVKNIPRYSGTNYGIGVFAGELGNILDLLDMLFKRLFHETK